MNKMKKLLALTLVCMILLSAFSFGTFAAEEERYPVYVQVPGDWEAPCVWAWSDDGKNVFEAWPGGELDADAANENWYYCWLPTWANNIIVNANGGTVQIEAVQLETKNAWVTITDAATVDISYDAKTQGEAPAYVEKFTVHAIVPESWESVGLWAWSAPDGKNAFAEWPGRAMRQTEDGAYVGSVPVWVNSLIINGNDGSVQTADISVDAAQVWVTVAEDNSFEISYDDPAKANIPNITVNVMAPADWAAPCLWAWSAPDGTNAFTAWPGEPLEAGTDGWLQKSVPGWVNSVIVNASEGTVQTTDISIETGKDIWLVITGPEEYTLTYEKPAISAPAAGSEAPAAPAQAGNNYTVIIVIAALVVVALAGGGFAVYKSKKK